VIESPQLQAIFLMLREELHDSNILHRTTVCNRLTEVWDEHLASLETDMKVWSICVWYPIKVANCIPGCYGQDFDDNGSMV